MTKMMMESSFVSLLSFMLLLTKVVVAQVRSDVSYDCTGRPADVIFVLDASNSIWRPDFLRQLEFVKDIVDVFKIGERNMMVGVITYAGYPQLQFQLNYYYRKSDLRAAIDNIRQDGGYETRTADALRYLRERAFLEAFGSRRQVAHVAVIITDGRSENKTLTALEAAKVKAEGVHLFAVGVGRNLDMEELKTVASEPVDYYTFLVDSYQGLARIKDLLAIKTCEVTHAPTTTPAPTTARTTTSTTRATTSTTRATTTPRRTTRTTKQYTTNTTATSTSSTTTESTTKPVITTPTTTTSKTTNYATEPQSTEILSPHFATPSFVRESVKMDSKEGTDSPIIREHRTSTTSDFDGTLTSIQPGAKHSERLKPEDHHEDQSGKKLKVTLEDIVKGHVSLDSGKEDSARPTIRFETPKSLDFLEPPIPPIYLPGDPEEKKYHELKAKNLTSVYEPEMRRPETDKYDAMGILEQTKRRRKTTSTPDLDKPSIDNGERDGLRNENENGNEHVNGNGYGNERENDEDYEYKNGHGNGNGNEHGNEHGNGHEHGNGNGHGDGNENGDRTVPSKGSSHLGIWSFDADGRLVREEGSEDLVNVAQLPPIPEDSDMFIEGDEIWILEKTGRRRLIGCIINGTHYIGHWIFDERGNRKWYGYPSTDLTDRIRNTPRSIIESAEHRLEPEPEKDNSRRSPNRNDESSSTGSAHMAEEEVIYTEYGEEAETEKPLTDEPEVPGYWGKDDLGRDVFYLIISPGVYELVYPEPSGDEGDGPSSTETSTDVFPTEYTQEPRKDKEQKEEDEYHPLTSDPSELQPLPEETEEILDPEGRKGYWGIDERGRQVWYLYTCPGVYVPVPEGLATDENGQPIAVAEAECSGVDNNGNLLSYTYLSPGRFSANYPDSTSSPEDPSYLYHAVGGKPESSLTFPDVESHGENPFTLSPSGARDSAFDTKRRPGSERDGDTDFVVGRPEAETGKPEVGVYKFDSNGQFERVKFVDAPNLKLSKIDKDDEVYVEGDQIWVRTKIGNRKLIGCIINGTHYIGVWVVDENGNKLWYGYPSKNLALRLRSEKSRSSPPPESTDLDIPNGRRLIPNLDSRDEAGYWDVDADGNPIWRLPVRVEVPLQELQEFRGNLFQVNLNDPLVQKTSTRVPLEDWTSPEVDKRRGNNVIVDSNGKTGHWAPDDEGRLVWYRYTCPGVYEPVPEGPPSVSPEDLESGEPEVDGVPGCVVKDEDGSDVWFVYVGPGDFRKVPTNGSPTGESDIDDVDNQKVKSTKDVASEKEVKKQPNKTKLQPTTVAPPSKPTRPRLEPTDAAAADDKNTKHEKHTKDKNHSKRNNGTGKGCRPRDPLDLIFVIDSKSDDDTSVGHLWNLTRDILSRLDLDDDRIQVRFIQECQPGSSHFDLGEFESKDNLIEALDSSLDSSSSSSSSSAQLIQTMADAFKRDDGRHGDVARRRVGVYITDGQSDDIEQTVGAAQKVKFADDVELFAVGVGQKVNPTELRAIASCEVDRHYYALSHHSKAATVARKISKVLCLGR